MSTILDALKKVEDDGPKAVPSEPNELDRQIVHGGSSSIARPVRRGAMFFVAVLVAAVAGAGLTMLGLAALQGDAGTGSETPAVASAGAAEDRGAAEALVAVEIDGEIEEVAGGERVQRSGYQAAGGGSSDPQSIKAMPATALFARAQDPNSGSRDVVNATPSMDRETIVIPTPGGEHQQMDPARKLAAVREARVSQVARGEEEKAAAEPKRVVVPAPEGAPRPEAKTAKRVVAPAEKQPVAEARKKSPQPRRSTVARETTPEPARPQPQAAQPIERPPVEIVNIARAKPTTPPPAVRSRKAESLPVIERASVPKLGVTTTTWHPYKSRRSAEVTLLEGGEARVLTVKQGDAVGPFKVAEITPTGVTLLHEGVELQRRVGAEAR